MKSGDENARLQLRNQLAQNLKQQQDTDLQNQDLKKSWQKLLISGFFMAFSFSSLR